jgi:cytochrome bd-type quinol oxidase subunit 2
MRPDLLFTILTIPLAFGTVLVGNMLNQYSKAQNAADEGGGVVVLLISFVCFVATVFSNLVYVHDHSESSDDDDHEQIPKGVTIAAAAFFGFLLFGTFVGPLNNSQHAWFDGWSLIVLAAVLPALLNLKTLIQERCERNAPTQLTEGVTLIKPKK